MKDASLMARPCVNELVGKRDVDLKHNVHQKKLTTIKYVAELDRIIIIFSYTHRNNTH